MKIDDNEYALFIKFPLEELTQLDILLLCHYFNENGEGRSPFNEEDEIDSSYVKSIIYFNESTLIVEITVMEFREVIEKIISEKRWLARDFKNEPYKVV